MTQWFKPEAAVIVPMRNSIQDFGLLNRFLISLRQSDFTEKYLMYLPTGGTSPESRKDGVKEAIKSGCNYIVVSDNDCQVPMLWWQKYLEIFSSDPKIGVITVRGEYPTSGYRELVADREKLANFDFRLKVISYVLGKSIPHEQTWDGFVVFKREFCTTTGVLDGSFDWTYFYPEWKVVVCDTEIQHGKSKNWYLWANEYILRIFYNS